MPASVADGILSEYVMPSKLYAIKLFKAVPAVISSCSFPLYLRPFIALGAEDTVALALLIVNVPVMSGKLYLPPFTADTVYVAVPAFVFLS